MAWIFPSAARFARQIDRARAFRTYSVSTSGSLIFGP